MPEENSAANEHAIMQEITAPLATLPDDAMPMVTDVDFPIVLRGYDRLAVDAYVKKTSQLVAELQATRSPEAAVRRALERVGEQISGILQRSHETAASITEQSRREAEDRLEIARKEAAAIVDDAEQRIRDLDSDTDRIWAERHRIVGDARSLAEELFALAESAGEQFPASPDMEEGVEPGPAIAEEPGAAIAEEPGTLVADEPTVEDDPDSDEAGETMVMPPLDPDAQTPQNGTASDPE